MPVHQCGIFAISIGQQGTADLRSTVTRLYDSRMAEQRSTEIELVDCIHCHSIQHSALASQCLFTYVMGSAHLQCCQSLRLHIFIITA